MTFYSKLLILNVKLWVDFEPISYFPRYILYFSRQRFLLYVYDQVTLSLPAVVLMVKLIQD